MKPRSASRINTGRPQAGSQRKALLVIEDPMSSQLCLTTLEEYGYQVRACHSFQEGVCCLADEAFDFVMVSQGTPNFEGSCVLKRATETNRSLPVLVVARCLDMGCYLEAMQLGAVDYLVEPLTMSDIGRVLEAYRPYPKPGGMCGPRQSCRFGYAAG
jgi:DNA-binding NtrC family response regulator